MTAAIVMDAPLGVRWFAFAVLLTAAGWLAPGRLLLAQDAIVVGMQMPAWLIRDARSAPLAVGAPLRSADEIRTGAGARVVLRLPEESLVKLGENARLELEALQTPPADRGLYAGVMNVLTGAFRFTTTAFGPPRRRDYRARVASVTIGIRGTDVWGKAEARRDFVILLDGEVTVERDGVQLPMRDPLTVFMAPVDQPALPIGPVEPGNLARWAQETELQLGQGMLTEQGSWQLNLASFRDQASAAALQAEIANLGYATELMGVKINDVDWTRVIIAGFPDRGEAQAAAAALTTRFGLQSPWSAPVAR